MKKILLLILMTLLPKVVMADKSGTCGENVTWNYMEETKLLVISGRGAISYSYFSNDPWADFREEVETVVIKEGVTSIMLESFSRFRKLKNVTLPSSLTEIGRRAFWFCGSLTSITIPKNVTSIGRYAFRGCSSLTSAKVEVDNSTYDSRNDCNAIIETATNTLICGFQNTIIPNGVTSIYEYAFANQENLTSIIIPSSVTSIGWYAFGVCSNLKSMKVDEGNTTYDSRNDCNGIIETATNKLVAGCPNTIIPNSVTGIGEQAFFGCISLTSVTIPNSVTSIGVETFSGCKGLTSIVIPNSVTSIDRFAFSDCSNLTDVYCYAEQVPSIYDNSFQDTNISNGTLYVPAKSVLIYKAITPWSNFKEVVALADQEMSVKGVMSDNKCETISYNLGGQRTDAKQKGLQVVRKSDGTMKKVVRK